MPVRPPGGPPASSFQPITTGSPKWPIWSITAQLKAVWLTALGLAWPLLQLSAHYPTWSLWAAGGGRPLQCSGPYLCMERPSHLLPSLHLPTSYLSLHSAGCCIRSSQGCSLTARPWACWGLPLAWCSGWFAVIGLPARLSALGL